MIMLLVAAIQSFKPLSMIITMSSTLFCSIQSCKKLVSSNDNLSERTFPLTNTQNTKKVGKKDILEKIVWLRSCKKHKVIHQDCDQ